MATRIGERSIGILRKSPMGAAEDAWELRPRPHRQRVLKGAAIITGGKNSEIACTVRNMHSGGAELRLAPDVQVPSQFLLYVPVDGIGYRSIVRWRASGRLGVEFIGTETKPRGHYG